MKSFEERKAEVMFRSEIIVKKRKKRKKIILSCLPLAICLCVLAVTAAPRVFSGKKYSSAENAPPEVSSETESYEYSAPENSSQPNSNATGGTNAKPSSDTSTTELATVANDEVNIYYASDNEIKSEEVFLPCTPKDVFSAWKEKNGIGDEVKLIDIEIKDNSTTEKTEENGVEVYKHTMGDYFILNLTVSKNLESYYASKGEELLKESLKKTMTEYNGIEFDEYYLYLE